MSYNNNNHLYYPNNITINFISTIFKFAKFVFNGIKKQTRVKFGFTWPKIIQVNLTHPEFNSGRKWVRSIPVESNSCWPDPGPAREPLNNFGALGEFLSWGCTFTGPSRKGPKICDFQESDPGVWLAKEPSLPLGYGCNVANFIKNIYLMVPWLSWPKATALGTGRPYPTWLPCLGHMPNIVHVKTRLFAASLIQGQF